LLLSQAVVAVVAAIIMVQAAVVQVDFYLIL
jgi:hypothetical protein